MSDLPLSAIAFVFGLVLLAIAVAVDLAAGPFPVVAWCGGFGLLLVIGTIFERVRYKEISRQPPGMGFAATEEKFRDPSTGRWVQVYYNGNSGERRYVEIQPPP